MVSMKESGYHPTGHLEIFKRYTDGKEELVFEDHNLIASGLGATFAMFFAATGVDVSSYQIGYFQAGVSGITTATSAISELSSVLTAGGGDGTYGLNIAVDIDRHEVLTSGVAKTQDFLVINPAFIQKVDTTTVRFVVVLDEHTANGNAITEIGLFSRNPFELATERSLLVAYRAFDKIDKNSNFSLIFKWSIKL